MVIFSSIFAFKYNIPYSQILQYIGARFMKFGNPKDK